ncbi:HAD-IIIC family phosphatase [Actinocorallia sp. API 0066]|uniref:HAD-IIIC family phosphatase n=1 Tax=Actinocorallia sp. API 0066 TaxID=2896846 RepID=UPI001E50C9C5|nr:HAD-IIIC family phosphatase [Actinocorallia sp. API 0066]MCD0447594.1 HAD-IIIC family phosphatase [Actinocorallia sp. API 0066]
MADEPTLVKCLIWDLDNTLWEGTLVEQDKVTLTDAVRKVIVGLDERGILQSVSSRNDFDNAWSRLEELGVAEYFVVPRIGWTPAKSVMVKEIADELSFALETIAFIDDMPAERADVSYHHPVVRCYEAERAAELLELPEFTPAVLTVDGRRRRQMYKAAARRETARSEFTGPDEHFLRTLGIVLRIVRATEEEITRVEELTLRTSQMNATGVHYSDETLRALLADETHEVLVATLDDKFGAYGAVGVLLIEKFEHAWNVKLLATSCRVVFSGAGTVLLRWLADAATNAGVHLVADFRRTDRNRMAEVAYRFAGFRSEDCACAAGIPPTSEPGIERLHLAPTRQEPPGTMTVHAPDLGSPEAADLVWGVAES